MSIKVLLVDDVGELRLLYRFALEDAKEIVVVGEASDGAEAVKVAADVQPDIVLLDLAMPRMDGLAAIPELKRAAPDARILVLSGFASKNLATEAIARCAYAYLEKGMSVERIISQIREIHAGPAKVGCR